MAVGGKAHTLQVVVVDSCHSFDAVSHTGRNLQGRVLDRLEVVGTALGQPVVGQT